MSTLILKTRKLVTQYFREKLPGDIPLDMIYIPAGDFWMGAPESEIDSRDAERPQHFVKVPRFFLGKYPITQGQYQAIMGENPSTFKDDFNEVGNALQRPIENISWDDAQKFCEKLRELTGKAYRLPTEAEWEYACRGIIPTEKGKALTQEIWNEQYHQVFYCGEKVGTEIANYDRINIYDKGEYREQTIPVGYLGIANGFGLYDMHGNVWEWCEDDLQDNYIDASPHGKIAYKKKGRIKILRGGSWGNYFRDCRSAYRISNLRDNRNEYYGFRVAVSPERI